MHTGMTRPPTLLPVAATPVIRPRTWGNQAATSRPAGSTVRPEKVANCMKLSAYQCHSSLIRGRRQKLSPKTVSESTRIGRAPNRSIARPRSGAERPPTAANESDALISVRVHPKVSSIGAMNSPNAYCDTPTATAVDEKTTAMTRAPRKVRGRAA